jgi:hypothetical protein
MICKYIVLGLTTYLWLMYLTWETTHYHRVNDDKLKWYEKDLMGKR